MAPNPEPDNILAFFECYCPVMMADIYSPDISFPAEIKRRMARIVLEKIKFFVSKFLDVLWELIKKLPEIGVCKGI